MSGRDRIDQKRSKRDKQVEQSEQSINDKVRLLVDGWLDTASADSFEDLPANAKATLINRYIPQIKDTNAELEASYLSLTRSLSEFTSPEYYDLIDKLKALQQENTSLRAGLAYFKEISKHQKSDANEVYVVAMRIIEEQYKRAMQDRLTLSAEFVDPEVYQKALKAALDAESN